MSAVTTSTDPDIAPNIRAVYCSAINRIHSTLLVAHAVLPVNESEQVKHTTYKMLRLVAVHVCSMFQESFTCLQIAFVSSMHQRCHARLQRGNHTATEGAHTGTYADTYRHSAHTGTYADTYRHSAYRKGSNVSRTKLLLFWFGAIHK